jgi:hypothetical protein
LTALPRLVVATQMLLAGLLLAATLVLLVGLLAALVLLVLLLAAALLLLARARIVRLTGILTARIGHSRLLEGFRCYPGPRGKRPEMKRVLGRYDELCDIFTELV